MAYRFQFRGDKEANWKGVILADREIGLLIGDDGKNTNLYKIGDGKTVWENLSYFGFDGTISSSLLIVDGEDVDKSVLNKKSVVDQFKEVDKTTSDLNTRLSTTETNINNINAIIGTQGDNKDIYTELNSINTELGNVNTELNDINTLIGIKGEDNDNIYSEINEVKKQLKGIYQNKVLSTTAYDEMASDNGSGLHENTLYFVYE
jgi:regulator of replication initiation timing